MTSPQHYTRMCQAARDGVRPKTWQNLCTQLVKHYTAVIEQSHRVPLTFFGPIPELPRWVAKALGARV